MENNHTLLYLSEADEKAVGLDMAKVIDTLEQVHTARKLGKVQQPPKPGLRPVGSKGFIDGYLAYVGDTKYLGIKWLAGYFENPGKGLPFINGLILLNDVETGMPLSVMGCGYITGLRTAGVSGMGLRRLVTKKEVTISVIGCGLQGRTHLMAALSCGWNVKQVLCWNIRRPGAEKYREEMAALYPEYDISVADTMEEAVSQADVLLICAPLEPDGSTRIIPPGLLKPGVTIAAVNGDFSFLEETIPEIDRVYVDDNESYPVRKASPMLSDKLPEESFELAELVMGLCPGRISDTERILITTEGMAINDISCAYIMYKEALKKNIGVRLPIFDRTQE